MEPVQPSRRWAGTSAAVIVAAAFTLGAGGGYLSRRPPPPDTRFVNFDVETTPSEQLLEGWSTFEATAEGDTFAWCSQNACTMKVFARGPGERMVRLRTFPFRPPESTAQTLRLHVNDQAVATKTLPDGPSVQTFQVGASAWRSGTNLIRFEAAYAESPKERVPGSEDARRLSIALDWLEIVQL